jgi:hypothetical protein
VVNIRISFFPYDWFHSDQVEVNLYQQVPFVGSGIHWGVHDRLLKEDPRQKVVTFLTEVCTLYTGSIINLAVVNTSPQLVCRLVLFAKKDTEASRGRWKIKRSLQANLPEKLVFLNKGRCGGTVRFD